MAAGSVDAILRFQGPGEWEKEAENHFSLFMASDAVKACPLFAKTDREKVFVCPLCWSRHIG